jgi:hypothetical protein
MKKPVDRGEPCVLHLMWRDRNDVSGRFVKKLSTGFVEMKVLETHRVFSLM